jgi:hypothetical protein
MIGRQAEFISLLDEELIRQRNFLEDGFQIVIPVCPLANNPQTQIYFSI